MLLTLPIELVQLVLRSCEPSAYLQLAFCCRALFEIASNSRDLLVTQISQTPSRIDDTESLSTKQLLHLLLRYSHRQLFGAEFHSKFQVFDFGDKVIDCRASTLEVADSDNQALLVFKDHPAVYVGRLDDGVFNLQRRLESPARHLGEIKVLQAAYDSHGVYVLHRLQPRIEHCLDTNHPFVKQAVQSNSNGNVFLAHHELGSVTNTIIRLYGFQEMNGYEPLAFAAHRERFVISWQHLQHSHDHQVVLYKTQDQDDADGEDEEDRICDKMDSPQIINSRYDSYVLAEMNGAETENESPGQGPSVKLSFNDRGYQLLHYYRAHSLYGSFQRLHGVPSIGRPQPSINENACNVVFSDSLSLRFSIGIPFFYTHEAENGSLGARCHWQYLAVGIATHRVQHWTVACLLKSEAFTPSHRCDHARNLERGRRFDDWEIMAQLGGYQEPSTSHGPPIAASPLGTRIAIASWKTISVWALEPHVLITGDDSFYPESWQLPEGFPELRPTVIQLDAVCYQMRFIGKEDELLAITDRGLMLLSLKSYGTGSRMVESRSNWTAVEAAS
ncbi:uncharacterized protein N7459_006101 [Penicillium hispanicum]|uniref:uncharacterized protein n=1 Tax=Penicillium hispanicum TaxID=1080232 RepID=UPI00253F9D8F|nr:uncharacterized protein N7459_006101 [Penicillium hispanicum]KAJ5580116.1 hypothetical protein N7459_006101 [Penicillium hispanicum]